MNKTVKLKTSGIALIDNNWGGFYNGSTYLMYGPEKSGRTSMALQYAYHTVSKGEVCVFITDVRPRKLIISAHSQGKELQPLIDNNKLIILRTAQLNLSEHDKDHDEHLSEFFYNIINAVNEFQPSCVIFDELTPYMNFNNKEMFLDIFKEVVETLEEMLITSVFITQDDAEVIDPQVHNQLINIATGNIRLNKNAANPDDSGSKDKMSILLPHQKKLWVKTDNG